MFNLAFSIGSFIGPIVSGQALQGLGVENGFYTLVGISEGFFLMCIPMVIWKFPKPVKRKDKESATIIE